MATLLADLWDWWAEGVHLRPQPQIDENSGQLEWHRSSVERWIPRSKPFVIDALERTPEPIRSITLDAHLGDALFRLCAWVHFFGLHSGRREARRFQSVEGGKLRFRPGGDNKSYFNFLTNRINAGGWRPGGSFPNTVFAEAVDFSLCHVQVLVSVNANWTAPYGAMLRLITAESVPRVFGKRIWIVQLFRSVDSTKSTWTGQLS